METTARLEVEDMQGLILDGYRKRPEARYALIEIAEEKVQPARDWLGTLVDEKDMKVSTADNRKMERYRLNVAFTFKGLERLGLTQAMGFLAPFREGMRTKDRALDLGDTDDSDQRNWKWGGGSLHVLLMLFSEKGKLGADWEKVEADLGWAKVFMQIDANLTEREPFGFVDGISQPYIEGSDTSWRPSGAEARADTVKPGEFILGYLDEKNSLPTTPTIAAAKDPGMHLPLHITEAERCDFGRNGTYLVLRQLQQNVTEFESFLEDKAPNDPTEQQRIKAKMVGRWPNGAPLVNAPDAEPKTEDHDNAFGYHDRDPLGYACPLGAHIRRANPRDSVTDGEHSTPELALQKSRTHRLIRRGRVYKDATGTGMMFLCLNANIQDQFEFVQHSWINSARFSGLDGETDPLVGPRGPTRQGLMTIQSPAGKKRLEGLGQFVKVLGGDYFFLPGIKALRCLSALP